jgi:ATP adenylyltransferase
MNVIWAPWRMAYIRSSRKPAGCIFCIKARKPPSATKDASNLLLHRGRYSFVMMNLFPYNSGHLMVAPYSHVKTLEALPAVEALDLLSLVNLSLRVLRLEIKPEGFNIGINVGRVSGAGIADHIHLHIVPRWNGDTNFMPLFAETRVIPEHLEQTYRKLRARFRRLAPAAGYRNNPSLSDRIDGGGRLTRPRQRPPSDRQRRRRDRPNR